MPPVLVVAEASQQWRLLAPLFAEVGVTYRITTEPTHDCVGFCRRVARGVVVVTANNPLSPLIRLRTAGIDLPTLIVGGSATPDLEQDLAALGAVRWRASIQSARELRDALATLTAAEPERAVPLDAGIWLDAAMLLVGRQDRMARLTRCEFALLEVLADAGGRPVSTRELHACACGSGLPRGGPRPLISVHIHNLRKKLRPIGMDRAIVTVRNFGYRLDVKRSPSSRSA